MSWTAALLSLVMMVASPASVVLAQPVAASTASSTHATSLSPQNSHASSGSGGAALGIGLGIGAGIIGLSLLSGGGFFMKSFGGRIATVVPCVSGLGPSLHITIIPAGVFQPAYIWTPLTITKLAGPPRNPGQQVLGTADIPFVCFTPTVPPVPLYGQRIFQIGTSPLF